MSALLRKQQIFAERTAHLILQATQAGLFLTLGEVFRPEFTAKFYASLGSGIADSVHTIRLAIDLQLFDETGKYLTDPISYADLGSYWKSLSTPDAICRWGGDFTKRDACHFSIEHNGIS